MLRWPPAPALPDMELAGRCALVTGGAIRIGRALVLALAREGMRLAIHYHASRDEADETLRLVREQGGDAVLVRSDLTGRGEPERTVHAAADALGSLDVLVNSAAVMVRTPFGEVTEDDWDSMFALNLRAVFFASQAAAPLLRARGGAIVNIADLAAFESWPAYVPHGISKAGVVQLTQALARVLAPEVRVNAIAPGAVLLPEGWTGDEKKKIEKTTPLHRIGSPDDVVAAMLYLLRADYVTGETLIVDGGRSVRC